jgi:hypothetical protein
LKSAFVRLYCIVDGEVDEAMSNNPARPARPAGGVLPGPPPTYIKVVAFQSVTTSAWAGTPQERNAQTTSPVKLRSFDMIVLPWTWCDSGCKDQALRLTHETYVMEITVNRTPSNAGM